MDYEYFSVYGYYWLAWPKKLWSNLKFLKKALKNTVINSKKQDELKKEKTDQNLLQLYQILQECCLRAVFAWRCLVGFMVEDGWFDFLFVTLFFFYFSLLVNFGKMDESRSYAAV